MFLSFALSNCAITHNLKDGYDTGDIAKGLAEDVQIYCSNPIATVRKVARNILLIATGIMLPDVCPGIPLTLIKAKQTLQE